MPQSQSAAKHRHQKEEEKDKTRLQGKHTIAREAYKPAFFFPKRGDLNAKRDWKNENKEQGKTT